MSEAVVLFAEGERSIHEDEALDAAVRASHDEAQRRVGTESGSPVTAYDAGPAFFGPVGALAGAALGCGVAGPFGTFPGPALEGVKFRTTPAEPRPPAFGL